MFYDAVKNAHGLPNDPFKSLVAPRPIAWVSTVSPEGVANLAPYSFFNAFAESPHYLAIGSGGYKNTLSNAESSGEFVVNLVSDAMKDEMNLSSAALPPHQSEFEYARVEHAASQFVKAPRVAKAPAAFECRLHQIVPLPGDDGHVSDFMLIGRVLGIHIDDQFVIDGRVQTSAMRLVARLGYAEYTTVTDHWRLRRP